MPEAVIDIDARLLNDFQRDVPYVARPFREFGARLGIGEDEVLDRLRKLLERGAITRFGATCRPNTAGASTLAAVAAPDWDVERAADIINSEVGVNHSYLREHVWNIWFVVTGPDRDHVDRVLARIGDATGLRVLDLPLIQPFNIDLGFDLRGRRLPAASGSAPIPKRAPDIRERGLLQALSSGLPLVRRPFATLIESCGLDEEEALDGTRRLADEGFITRFGIIVRHRALGWRANAMVVWQMPPEEAAAVGPHLARVPGVTLCYQRRAIPGVWPYTLYNMIHGRSREEALSVLEDVRRLPGLADVPHEVLFSQRCFRQMGALIDMASAKRVQ